MCACACVNVCLCACVNVCLCACVNVCLCVCVSVCMSIPTCLHVYLHACLHFCPRGLPACLPICFPVCQSACPFFCLPFCLRVCLFTYVPIALFNRVRYEYEFSLLVNVVYDILKYFYILVDGGYTKWSDFNACSATCGAGIQMRQRNCTNPAPKYDGRDCLRLGSSKETKNCHDIYCPGNIPHFYTQVNMQSRALQIKTLSSEHDFK